MKLATSTGDFGHYVPTIAQQTACFQGTKFQNINLEQCGEIPELLADGDDWKRLAEDWGNAATKAGLKFVVSHAPCLHDPVLSALDNPSDETYRVNVRAIRRSIEICHMLGIPRIVVHACPHKDFDKQTFYAYNRRFYAEFFDLMEKYGITVMTENWARDWTKFSTGKEVRDFVDDVAHPLLGVCWDTAHCNISPSARAIGQYENILTVGEKLKGLHIADNFGDTHHHTWPFAGIINFDKVMQALLDVKYDGYFTFEASYTLLHQYNAPYERQAWEKDGKRVEKLLNPSIALKQKAVDLMYDVGEFLLKTYDCFEE